VPITAVNPNSISYFNTHLQSVAVGPAGARAPAVKPCAEAVPRELSQNCIEFDMFMGFDYFHSKYSETRTISNT